MFIAKSRLFYQDNVSASRSLRPTIFFLPYLPFIFSVLYTLPCVTPPDKWIKIDTLISLTFLSDVITSDLRTPSLPVLLFYNCHSGPVAPS